MGRDWADLPLAGVEVLRLRVVQYDVVAAGISGDLAYIVGIEHTTASVGGAPPAPYSLRVTTILRRKGDESRSSGV